METWMTLQQIDDAVAVIRSATAISPLTGIILGSGLVGLADLVEKPVSLPFSSLPHWPVSTVAGHSGRLVFGFLEGKPVMVLQGRIHYYEGYSQSQITFPIRVMQRLGIKTLFVTNAAGAIHPDYNPGDLMLIRDHISLAAMAGLNPLRGPNMDEFGPRFPDMSQPYSRRLNALARQVAAEEKLSLQEGVYVYVAGPSFESCADLIFLQRIGADAVGMSTVPEVIVARHGGMEILGISGISNKANLDGSTITTHEEVLQGSRVVAPKLQKVLLGVLKRI